MGVARLAVDLPCVCTTVRKASRALSRLYDEALAEAAMTAAQLAILRAVLRAGSAGQPLSRLADALVMDRTSLYRSLTPLIRKGWIALGTGPGGRAKVALLTAAGRRATESAAAHWGAAQTRMVRALGTRRWQALHQDLAELADLGTRFGEQGARQRRRRSTATAR